MRIGGESITSPLVYFLMEADPWLTIYIGLGCLVLGTGLTFMLPETLPKEQRQSPPENAESPWRDTIRSELAKLGQAISWVIWKDRRVALLLFTFLLTTLGRFAQEILLQYATNRYGWSWSQVRNAVSLSLGVTC
jgi:hypothetical protein